MLKKKNNFRAWAGNTQDEPRTKPNARKHLLKKEEPFYSRGICKTLSHSAGQVTISSNNCTLYSLNKIFLNMRLTQNKGSSTQRLALSM